MTLCPFNYVYSFCRSTSLPYTLFIWIRTQLLALWCTVFRTRGFTDWMWEWKSWISCRLLSLWWCTKCCLCRWVETHVCVCVCVCVFVGAQCPFLNIFCVGHYTSYKFLIWFVGVAGYCPLCQWVRLKLCLDLLLTSLEATVVTQRYLE